MAEKPKVSVLIPVYNGALGINRTLESLANQTYQDFEVIVVDDGSTDDTVPVVEKVYPRATIVKQKNAGIAAALNHGIEYCNGEYIARIDCYDISYPNRFNSQVKFLDENHEYGIVGGHILLYEIDGTELGICKYPINSRAIVTALHLKNPSILHEAAMIRKSTLLEVGGYDVFYNGREDYELWCRISMISKLHNLDQVVTKSLSTTSGLSFNGMKLQPLMDLALIERFERKTKGISWKNNKLRDAFANNPNIAKVNKRILENANKAKFYNRRASLLLRSGDKKSAYNEFVRAANIDRKNIKSMSGMIAAKIIPVFIIKSLYFTYRMIGFIKFYVLFKIKNAET